MNPFDAILRTNPEYADAMLRRYQDDPSSVPVSWAAFFAGWEMGLREAAAVAPPEAATLPLPLSWSRTWPKAFERAATAEEGLEEIVRVEVPAAHGR